MLDADAMSVLDLSDPPSPGDLHEWLHDRISAAGRALRGTRPGIAVHAGAAQLSDGRGLLILGNTGAGKSTLTTLLALERGASVVSDDTVWAQGTTVTGFGAPIAVRANSPVRRHLESSTDAIADARLLANCADLGIERCAETSVSVIVVASFGATEAAAQDLTPVLAFGHLMSSLLRTPTDSDLDTIAELAGSCHSALITYGDANTSLEMADRVIGTATTRRVRHEWLESAFLASAGFGDAVRAIRFADDVALWHSVTGHVVCLENWPDGQPIPVLVRADLHERGLLKTQRSVQ